FLVAHVVMGHLAWIALTTSEEYAVTLRGFLIGAVMEISYLLLWLRFYYVSYLQRGGKKYVQHKRLDGQKAE
ncbi:fatty acid elongation protein 3, partial [Aphelenchoides avenae]